MKDREEQWPDVPKVDRRATAALGLDIMMLLRRHYRARPQGRGADHEAAKALALATATVLVAAGRDGEMLRPWFDEAVDKEVERLFRERLADSPSGQPT